MADCAACGSRVEDGLTKCPQCGVKLEMPGAFVLALGWVLLFASLLPLVVGAVTWEQKDYRALVAGVIILVAGIVMIGYGRTKSKAAPATTRPSAAPVGPPPAAPTGK